MNLPPDLESRLKSQDESVRYQIFLDLYHSEAAPGSFRIEDLLAMDDPIVKLIFMRYLEEIPDRKAAEWLLALRADSNPVVRQNALRCFTKNQYGKKYVLLRPDILSPDLELRRVALDFLSKRRDYFILPTLLVQLAESGPEMQADLLKALRYLPDARVRDAVLPLADSPDETVRLQALRALLETQRHAGSVPREVFLNHAWDPSEKVRKASLMALELYSSRKIALFFLKKAQSEDSMENRVRAIDALASFPDPEWVEPLVRFILQEVHSHLKLAAEVALKRFPVKAACRGLLPLLESHNPAVGIRSALLLAEINGDDPAVRKRLLKLWRKTQGTSEQLSMLNVLRELGGEEVTAILAGLLKGPAIIAYSAAGALVRLWSEKTGGEILVILDDDSIHTQVKQTLLQAVSQYGPPEPARDRLFDWIAGVFSGTNINFRYLGAQILAWYPLDRVLPVLIRHLPAESDETTVETIDSILIRKLDRNPMPLIRALEDDPKNAAAFPHACRIFSEGYWKKEHVPELLNFLLKNPSARTEEDRGALVAALISLFEKNIARLDQFWDSLKDRKLRMKFLEKLKDGMQTLGPKALRVERGFIAKNLVAGDHWERALLYQIARFSGDLKCLDAVVDSLLREEDPACLSSGRQALGALVWRSQRS